MIDLFSGGFGYVLMMFIILIIIINLKTSDDNDPDEQALHITAEWDMALPTSGFLEEGVVGFNEYRKRVLEMNKIDYLKPGHSTADVDLWVVYESPEGSCEIIGYPGNIQSSQTLKLDEDDRGWEGSSPFSDENREVASSRVSFLPKGRYKVALHMYDKGSDTISVENPIAVEVKITINKGRDVGNKVFVKTIEFTSNKQEFGMLFEIDDKGNFVPDSFIEPNEDILIANAESGLRRSCGNDVQSNASAQATTASPQGR
jgi:hypothetical protein